MGQMWPMDHTLGTSGLKHLFCDLECCNGENYVESQELL